MDVLEEILDDVVAKAERLQMTIDDRAHYNADDWLDQLRTYRMELQAAKGALLERIRQLREKGINAQREIEEMKKAARGGAETRRKDG